MPETNRRHVALHFHLGSQKGAGKRYEEAALNEQSLR